MVTYIRHVKVNGVQNQEKAIELAKKAAAYVNGRFGFSEVRAGMETFGHVGSIYWIGRQESLDSVARGAQEALADPGYQQLAQEGAGIFLPGTVEDVVLLDLV